MRRLVVNRIVAMVPMLLIVTFATFMLMSLVPGDPARTLAGEHALPEDVEAIRESLHLDEPLLEQYGRWLVDAVQLDFGTSLYREAPVTETLSERFPVTMSLAVAALLVALAVGLPLGIISGVRPGGWSDRAVRTFSSLGFAIPNFWLALLLVIAFAVQRTWLPASGFVRLGDSPLEWLRYITLPAITLGFSMAALIARQLRAGIVDVMEMDFVRAAWARGAPRHTVIGRHAMKNAALPVITTVGLQFGALLGGTVIIEQIFSIPGLGASLISSIGAGDLPVIQGIVVVFVVTQVAVSLFMDLGYAWVNPKVRTG